MYEHEEELTLQNAAWWEERISDEERGQRCYNVYKALYDQDSVRRNAYHRFLRLYGNLPAGEGGAASAYAKPSAKDRITFNVIANMCDFATSRIGKGQPLPVAKTRGGNWSLYRKGKLLNRFFEAQFRISKVYSQARRWFLDATILGTGVLHPYHDGRQIKVERVFPVEILVDHTEATLGGPRQMMREKYVSRDVLRHMFVESEPGLSPTEAKRRNRIIDNADNADAEKASSNAFDAYLRRNQGVSDQVRVVEAWHLPSGPGGDDGRHAFFLSSGLLESEPWEHEDFPFIFLRWKEHPLRWWGIGLAEELMGIQIEMNMMLRKIQQAHHLVAKPFILLSLQSQIPKGALDNELGTILRYAGEKPEIWTPPAFHPEFYAHFDRLYQRAFEIAGFTQEGPGEGARSGEQLVKKHAIETERFSIVALNFEEGLQSLGEHMIRLAKELGPNFATPAARDKYSISVIKWKEIDMAADQYYLAIQNTSALSTLFSERVNQVILMLQAGLVGPEEAKRLVNAPDLDRHAAWDMAPEDNIDRIIEKILDDGEVEPPEPYMPLDLAFQKMSVARSWAAKEGVEEAKLAAMDDWLVGVHRLQERAALEQAKKAAMAAAGMEPGAMPPGTGAPPAVGNQGAPPTEPSGPGDMTGYGIS